MHHRVIPLSTWQHVLGFHVPASIQFGEPQVWPSPSFVNQPSWSYAQHTVARARSSLISLPGLGNPSLLRATFFLKHTSWSSAKLNVPWVRIRVNTFLSLGYQRIVRASFVTHPSGMCFGHSVTQARIWGNQACRSPAMYSVHVCKHTYICICEMYYFLYIYIYIFIYIYIYDVRAGATDLVHINLSTHVRQLIECDVVHTQSL